jgi:hypothetical protein
MHAPQTPRYQTLLFQTESMFWDIFGGKILQQQIDPDNLSRQ